MKIEKINTLPNDLIVLIKSFIPKTTLLFLNNYYYKKYHYLIKKYIKGFNFENYIRTIIRQDNSFVFSQILIDYNKDISNIKQYIYKNILYKKYYYFLIDYCIKNNSIKCRDILNDFLKLQGLCQNRHKKNTFIHIRWKH
jgi:hypothetical protein